jgi:hypothetical protein
VGDLSAPIPMLLLCPACGKLHIDLGEFATKPHHTHACQHCGAVWRPAIVPTVGVLFLPGFKNGEGDLTPSEVALAKVLAAWEEWTGDDSTAEGNTIYQMGDILYLGGWIESGFITSKGKGLLDRARKAGVV